MDLSKLSDEDLLALSTGDVTKLSDGGLEVLAGLPPKKRKTTIGEDIGIGLGQAGSTVTKGLGLLAGSAAGALGFDDTSDAIFKKTDQVAKDTTEFWTPKDAEQNFMGKVIGMGATLPAQMMAMPFSPADTGMTMLNNGETLDKAQMGSLIDTTGNVIGFGAPGAVGKTLGKKIVSGAAMNAGQDYLTRKAITDLADTKATKDQFEPTAETTGLAAVLGGGFGMLHPTDPKADGNTGTKYFDYKPEIKEEPYSLKTDIERQVDVLRTNKAGIEDSLSRQTDPNSEYSNTLREELRQTENSLIKLETELGVVQPTVDTPRTDVEAPRIDEQVVGDTQVPVKEFEPLPTRQLVKESILSKDLSDYSSPVLENMLANKQRKIDEAYNAILENGIGSEAGWRALSFKDTLQEEYDHINSFLNKKPVDNPADTSFNKDFDPIALKDDGLTDMVMRNDVRGSLDRIAQMGKEQGATDFTKSLSKVAETLLGNPNVGLGKYALDPLQAHGAAYSNRTGDTTFRGSKDITPINVVHEALHSAVNKALIQFSEGKLTNFVQKQAAQVLTKLHSDLKTNTKFLAALDKAVGEKSRGIFLENVREMVAYGTTHPAFQQVLHDFKLGKESLYSKLGNAVKNILGFKGQERSAFDELMKYSERLIELSDGTPRGAGDPSFAKLHTAQGIRDAIQSGSLKVFAHGFTAQMRQMMRNNPHFSAISKMVSDVEWAREAHDIDILYGKDGGTNGKGFFFRLKGPESEKAVVPAMYTMKNKDISGIFDLLADGYRKGITMDETLAKNPNLPEHQIRLAKALQEGYRKLAESVWRMYGSTQLPQRLAERLGYLLTTRTGPHQVHVSFMGIPLRMESFLTEAEAKQKVEWFRKQAGDKASVEYLRSDDVDTNSKNITDLMESLQGIPQNQIHAFLTKKLEVLERNNADIQGHQKHSNILSGFTGDQAGMSAERRGALLREAIPRSIKQYSQAIATREINKRLIDYLIDNEHKMDKTTKELTKFYVETQTVLNRPEHGMSAGINKFSVGFRESIDTAVDSIFGFHGRDKHAVDRFTGLFQNVFSTFNITMKPAIWIAQPLQAMNSMRSAFKEGESPRQVAQAMGQTMAMLAKGAKNADPEFLAHLQKVAEEHNTLHPQMMNEFNDFKFGHNPNTWPNYIMDVITGKRISAGGDKFSRFASFAFFWNLHKQSGLKGEELYKTAARDATENMVAYGKKALPAMYRETGIFGEQASPLMTFAHAQLGNMIVDIKEFVQTPNARTVAPLIITGTLATILGGAISAPLVAEYELLRLAGIKMGWWGATTLPSVRNLINTHAPEMVSHGVLSAGTGVDVDASMRYQSLMAKVGDIESEGFLQLFPHLAWGKDFLAETPTLVKAGLGGDVAREDVDQAFKKTLPKGWPSGAVDAVRHGGDLFTKMKDGSALVPRGTAEAAAPWFGSRSIKEAEAMDKHFYKQQMDKDKKLMLDNAVKAFTNGQHEKFAKVVQRLIKDHSFSDGDAVVNAIVAKEEGKYVPILLRDYAGKTGNMSKSQQEAFVRDEMATFLRKHNQ